MHLKPGTGSRPPGTGSRPPSEAWLSCCLVSVVRKTQLEIPIRTASANFLSRRRRRKRSMKMLASDVQKTESWCGCSTMGGSRWTRIWSRTPSGWRSRPDSCPAGSAHRRAPAPAFGLLDVAGQHLHAPLPAPASRQEVGGRGADRNFKLRFPHHRY